MFIAYTDASIKEEKAYLAFLIIFEDKSMVRRRIIVNQTDSNIAEALAINELLSFLRYYKFTNGLILFDANGVKKQLKWKYRQIHKYIHKNTYKELRKLNVRTQLINRKLNLSHKICQHDKYLQSHPISKINRKCYLSAEKSPELYMQPSVLKEYREIYNKHFVTFHEAQMNLNNIICLADLVEDTEGTKVYAISNRRIKVTNDTVVKLWKVNH
ncbi:hypothetical protein ACNA6I_17445 [Rossellomorea sp. FS2]|uniref:hypothetical protein n=1 Tax=Rossellomorea sp. FS2 TaxID=3391447 RepID=UPI003A4E486E